MLSNKTATAGLLVALSLVVGSQAIAENKPVGITPDMMSVEATHNGETVTIQRNQDNANTIIPAFAKTSRHCPPFCIQPMTIAPGVETLGELELLDYVTKMHGGDSSIVLADSRTPDWVERGTIPGAINVPWTELAPGKGATTASIMALMSSTFGVAMKDGADEFAVDEAIANGSADTVFDYGNAKTLVLFCNGMWCGQSPTSIRTLLNYGYPAEKIKWYRDGMQGWEILGFNTVKP